MCRPSSKTALPRPSLSLSMARWRMLKRMNRKLVFFSSGLGAFARCAAVDQLAVSLSVESVLRQCQADNASVLSGFSAACDCFASYTLQAGSTFTTRLDSASSGNLRKRCITLLFHFEALSRALHMLDAYITPQEHCSMRQALRSQRPKHRVHLQLQLRRNRLARQGLSGHWILSHHD